MRGSFTAFRRGSFTAFRMTTKSKCKSKGYGEIQDHGEEQTADSFAALRNDNRETDLCHCDEHIV